MQKKEAFANGSCSTKPTTGSKIKSSTGGNYLSISPLNKSKSLSDTSLINEGLQKSFLSDRANLLLPANATTTTSTSSSESHDLTVSPKTVTAAATTSNSSSTSTTAHHPNEDVLPSYPIVSLKVSFPSASSPMLDIPPGKTIYQTLSASSHF